MTKIRALSNPREHQIIQTAKFKKNAGTDQASASPPRALRLCAITYSTPLTAVLPSAKIAQR
jgi:hypothetical protein